MRHRAIVVLLLAAALLAAAPAAQAKTVVVGGERFGGISTINTFYGGLSGVTSSIIPSGTEFTAAHFAGVDLFWMVQPANPYTAGELAAMAGFLAGGGRIAFMGEHGGFAPAENDRITAAIAALGGHIAITNIVLDGGFQFATIADGQIQSHTLTTGVSTYEYAAFAPLVMGPGAETLMLGADLSSVMMGFENIGPGSIFLITDQNVWDHYPFAGSDNDVMFENLLSGVTGAPPPPPPNPKPGPQPIPEPGTIALFGLGILGLVAYRRRRKLAGS